MIAIEAYNAGTQPLPRFRVFNRGDVLPRAWYFAGRSEELPRMGVVSLVLGTQKLVLFRDEHGNVGALDAFCPHMGTDLSLGKVVDGHLRCMFHHWRFSREGACVRTPCRETPPATAKVNAYAVVERYGALWVYPDTTPDHPMMEVPGLEGKDVVVAFDTLNTSNAPYHVSMVNGLDVQHLATVHDIALQMQVILEETPGQFDAVVDGPLPDSDALGWLLRTFVGKRYAYAMRYAQATVAGLVLLRHTRWPELTMIFAYRPLPGGRSMTQPIFVAERRPGVLGWLRARVLLLATKIAYRVLEDEDERIYDHIRFTTRNLLAMDAPVARYIRWVEGLTPSVWSAPNNASSESPPERAG